MSDRHKSMCICPLNHLLCERERGTMCWWISDCFSVHKPLQDSVHWMWCWPHTNLTLLNYFHMVHELLLSWMYMQMSRFCAFFIPSRSHSGTVRASIIPTLCSRQWQTCQGMSTIPSRLWIIQNVLLPCLLVGWRSFLLLRTDWSSPLDLRRGWLLYGGIGVIGAAAAVVAVSTLAVTVTGQPPPREVCFLGFSWRPLLFSIDWFSLIFKGSDFTVMWKIWCGP
jgi:hypothetical protein